MIQSGQKKADALAQAFSEVSQLNKDGVTPPAFPRQTDVKKKTALT